MSYLDDILNRMPDPRLIGASMGQIPDPADPVAPPPGLLARLFGPQGINAPASLVPQDLLHQLGKRSLLAAGLGMMQASHTRGQNRLGAGLAAGLQAGQETYASGLKGAEEQGLLKQKVDETERIDALRKSIAAKYPAVAGETAPQKVARLTNMAMEYAQGGDHQTAANLVATANALRMTANGLAKPRYFQQNGKVTRVDPDGTIKEIIDDGSLESRQEIAKANLAARQQGLGLSGQRLLQRQGMNFYSRNKKVIDWGHALNQAISTITDAKGNKYLTSSTIANFVQAADQNARLQIQMLNYFKDNIDLSFIGKWENWKQRALTGQYKPEVYAKLLEHLKSLQGVAKREYDSQRKGELENHPDVEPWILDSEAAMGNEEDLGATTAPAGNPLDSF